MWQASTELSPCSPKDQHREAYKTIFQESPLETDMRVSHRNLFTAEEPTGISRKYKPASPEAGAASTDIIVY